MKICYLCADLGISLDGHKGAAAHVRGLVKAMTFAGHDVVLIASRPGNLEISGARVVPIERPPMVEDLLSGTPSPVHRALSHLLMNVAVERTLVGVVQEFDPDVLYERYSPFSAAGGMAASRLGVQHILEINAPLAWEGRTYRKQALYEAAEELENKAISLASLVISVSENLRDILVEQGAEEAKLAVVPNGVDTELFTPEGPTRRPKGDFVIGFVGGLRPWHGIHLLEQSFRILATDSRFQLLVVGHGPEAKVLKKLEEEFPSRVTLTGAVPQNQVPGYLRSMDVAVAPYPTLEHFYYSPLKLLEYMATGRAIVTTDVGGIRQLIRHGETGIIVAPDDANAIADAVFMLAGDDQLRLTIGRRAAEEARNEHSWEKRLAAILNAAEQIKRSQSHMSVVA